MVVSKNQPSTLRVHGKSIVNDETDLIVAEQLRSIDPKEIAKRWNQHNAMVAALQLAVRNARSRYDMLPLAAPECDRITLATELTIYEDALAVA